MHTQNNKYQFSDIENVKLIGNVQKWTQIKYLEKDDLFKILDIFKYSSNKDNIHKESFDMAGKSAG